MFKYKKYSITSYSVDTVHVYHCWKPMVSLASLKVREATLNVGFQQ